MFNTCYIIYWSDVSRIFVKSSYIFSTTNPLQGSSQKKPLLFQRKFQSRNKTRVFRAFIAWWKPRRIREQISENPRCCRGFSPAREFSQTLPRFSTGYGSMINMFNFFYKIIIFIVNKEKDDKRSAYCKFSQHGDSLTTLLTPFSCFIAVSKHTCRPIKTHVLSKLFHNVS